MIKMKALQPFTGQEGNVRVGREFEVGTDARADDLARLGLAVRVTPPPVAVPAPVTRARFPRFDDV